MQLPGRIVNDTAAAALRLLWPDGMEQVLDYTRLRASCRCAFCQSQRLRGAMVSEAGVTISALHDQGYGLQIVFSDGHDRGIYPWSYIRSMTPIPAPLPPSTTPA